MEKFADWLSQNPYGVIITFFIGIAGILVTIIIAFIQKRKKILSYSVYSTALVKEGASGINDIEILYKGEKIDKLSVASIYIWNAGNTIIESSDVYENHELRINIPKSDILNVSIISQSADTIKCDVDNDIIRFNSMEKKDNFVLNVYYNSNDNNSITIEGKIKEGKIVRKGLSDEDVSKIGKILLNTRLGSSVDIALEMVRLIKGK